MQQRLQGPIANSNKTLTHNINPQIQHLDLYPPINPIDTITDQEKIEYLQLVDQKARAKDHRVKEVIATLAGSNEAVLIVDRNGRLAADIRPMVRMSVNVIVRKTTEREEVQVAEEVVLAYNFFDQMTIEKYAGEAVDQALLNLEAIEAPAGEMTVVLGSGWPGVLIP